jgi:hypothetical protein
VEREVTGEVLQSLVLLLKVLHLLDLIPVYRTVLSLPPVVDPFGNADVPNRVCDGAAFGPSDLYLAELRDNLIRGVTSLLQVDQARLEHLTNRTHWISFR